MTRTCHIALTPHEGHCASDHRQLDCLFWNSFWITTKANQRFALLSRWEGNPPLIRSTVLLKISEPIINIFINSGHVDKDVKYRWRIILASDTYFFAGWGWGHPSTQGPRMCISITKYKHPYRHVHPPCGVRSKLLFSILYMTRCMTDEQ